MLGESGISHCSFRSIPRGGYFVLGMLSYLLDLERKALWSPSPDGLLVIVDDCALSGARFYYALHSVPNERVIFAHLYSPPELRAAILAQEPRVVACVAAHDLRDSARERYPDEAEYKAWQQRWRERLPEPRYWVGLPEPVVFPWSEPERSVWNAETGEVKRYGEMSNRAWGLFCS